MSTVFEISLEDGTELKITSSGLTGSILLDADKGVRIISEDENLDMTLTTSYMSTDISGIKGTIYYKEGNVSFDENLTYLRENSPASIGGGMNRAFLLTRYK